MENNIKSQIIKLFKSKSNVLSICNQLDLRPSEVLLVLENENMINQNTSTSATPSNIKTIFENSFEYIPDDIDINEIKKNGISVAVKCLDCGNKNHYNKIEVSNLIQSPSSIKFLGRLFGRIQCNKCKSPRLTFSNIDGKKILDIRNIKFCAICNDPITIQRIEIFPKTNTCSLCAENKDIQLKYDQREKCSIKYCPECDSECFTLNNMFDKKKYIYCINFSEKRIPTENFCSWKSKYISINELENITKKNYRQLRTLRLNHARKYQISPYKLLTDAQMTMLSHKKPNSKKDLDSYGFENNNFINENVEQIIAIFKK